MVEEVAEFCISQLGCQLKSITTVILSYHAILFMFIWPCGVCSKGVGSNSLQCTSCPEMGTQEMQWDKGSMSKVAKLFICRGCLNPVTSAGRILGPVQSWS